ncbi:MAG TPA: hypothetical protein VF144_12640 [Chitinophagaceae bacterium]
MEVHAHTHTPRRKWSHYFWEFLMLFLAVFCGFLAEYQLEHTIEHQREKQYVNSILEDLKGDIKQLDSLINTRIVRKVFIDSLNIMLDQPDPDVYGSSIYYSARLLTVTTVYFSNDRTIQQLKNGGNLRLIRKQRVSDAIMSYDNQVRWNGIIIDREQFFVREYTKLIEEIFDSRVFNKMATGVFGFERPRGNPKLLKKDKATIQLFLNKLHFLNSVNSYLLMMNNQMLDKAQQTKAIIEEEYNVK